VKEKVYVVATRNSSLNAVSHIQCTSARWADRTG